MDRSRDLGSRQLPSHSNESRSNSVSSDGSWAGTGGSLLDSAAVRDMVSVMGGFAMGALLDASGRQELRDKCSDLLQMEHGVNVQYAEQAVLANLDWGIDGLEKAVKTTNIEARAARLEHTEKMLQVAVLLDPKEATAGVPNSYLSAWANFYMALVWKLRNNDRNVALHMLDMFILEPSHARRNFVPALWKELFRPHMANTEAWYQGELEQIMKASTPLTTGGMFPIPKANKRRTHSQDSSFHSRSFSKSQDELGHSNVSSPARDETFDEEQVGGMEEGHWGSSLAPDQMMRRELLIKLYQDSLDENTKQYAHYYRDWMVYESSDKVSGDGDPTQLFPAFPRIVNPSHSSSFTRLQETRAGPAGHAEQSRLAAAANGAFKSVVGDVSVLPKRVTLLRRPSMDKEHDSFCEDLFEDAPDYSTNNFSKKGFSIPEVDDGSLGEVTENGHQRPVEETGNGSHQTLDSKCGVEEDTAVGDNEENVSQAGEFEGAGVYLDEEELSEKELLQVWEEIAEGRITQLEARVFLSQLTGDGGQPFDLKRLSEAADAVRVRQRNHTTSQQPSENYGSDSACVSAKYSNSPLLDIEEEEEEEAEVKIRQEFDRPDSPDTLSRMNSQSSRSSHSSLSSRNIIFQLKPCSGDEPLVRPPKDFVCSITNQLFLDPVTLETGQTYERGAVKEWLDRGNTSCPITRHALKIQKLPRTNYVLKRLVDNWKDDHPEYFQETHGEAFPRNSPGRNLPELEVFAGSLSPRVHSERASILSDEIQRPSRRIGQKVSPLPVLAANDSSSANLEAMVTKLKSALETLFRTEDLNQCESAAIVAADIWVQSKRDAAVAASLSRAGVVEGLMEVLSSSKKDEILRSIVCLLSDLICKDEFTRHTIMRTDPEIDAITSVLKNPQIPQVAVLLHLLKVPATQLSALKVIPILVLILKHDQLLDEAAPSMCMNPKAAAVYILEELVTTLDHRSNMANAESIVKAEGVPSLMERLEAKSLEEKISVVAVLWSCLQSNGSCRLRMVQHLKIWTLVDLLHNSKEQARTVAIFFLAELIRLNRRRVIEKILRDVLQEGFLNSMHVLMLHLQMSPLEHRPLVASLLLQLDLLAEPQKHSVYREEAVEVLVEALAAEDNAKVQLEAAKALASLSGRYSNAGKPVTEASLLKVAGLEDDYTRSLKSDLGPSSTEMDQSWEDDQRAADDWDQRMALAVLGSGRSLIEALGVILPSKSSKLVRPCVIATAWLTGSLQLMPDSNLLSYARSCMVPSLVSILQSARDADGRVLACLSLHNLTDDKAGVQQLTRFTKDLVGPLRQLRRYTWTAKHLLEALATNSMDVNVEMWEHGKVGQLDASRSGETRALLYFAGCLYSGHADASIKVWQVKRQMPQMVQEVREHTRSVLCLTGLEKECKVFSGSADKTVRVWLVQDQRMRCVQVIDVHEAAHSVAVNLSFICVIPQGVGLKVFDAAGTNPKLLNSHKHVQSLIFGEKNVYCGCTDSSIQEIDLVHETSVTIQAGLRSLRGKKAIYSMQLFNSELFAGGTIVDGIAVKIWKLSTRLSVSSIATQIDVRVLAISEDFMYLASNLPMGVVEVWLRETNQKVASFVVGSKILSLALVGETLYTGSADGKVRAWALI